MTARERSSAYGRMCRFGFRRISIADLPGLRAHATPAPLPRQARTALDRHGNDGLRTQTMSESALEIQLDPYEARVFGVLVEKALTTPDQYPLTLNAVTNGANQKSNRDPVLSLDEVEVAGALQRLEGKYMVRKVFPGNSRVEKYCHNGKDALNLEANALAVLAELLMRGPQTPGDLRARAQRMAVLPSQADLTAVLERLIARGLV